VSEALHIAVLGDVHGHLTLALRVLRRWEREAGLALDLILQVGDLGAFPPPFRMDKATRRFAEKDPDELGFARYHEGDDEARETLTGSGPRRVRAPLVFIRGNHEDFDFLDEVGAAATEPVPVDAFGRLWFLPNGVRWTFTQGPHAFTLVGLGGVSDRGGPGHQHRSVHYTRKEVHRLYHGEGPVDVLLSHEPPFDAAREIHPKYASSGSRDVSEALALLGVRYHFCGHYHEPGQPLHAPEGVSSWILNAVNFHGNHPLNPGCVGILRWKGGAPDGFSVLDAPWLRAFTRQNYRHL
jgi:hypothetical protein